MGKRVKVGVAQLAPAIMDIEKCVQKALNVIEDAASRGCELLLFPEAYIPCYPKAITFGSVVGWRTPGGRRDWRRYVENSIQVGDKYSNMLAEAAGKANLHLAMGAIEKEHGTLYCSMLFYGPDGKYLGKHRKLKPTAGERLVWGEGDASDLTVIDAPFGKYGAVICWENYMPLLRTAMYDKGIEIYLAPTADYRDTWHSTVRHIAKEGACFVLTSNLCFSFDDYSKELETVVPVEDVPEGIINEKGFLTNGGSAIIDPFGNYIIKPVFDKEDLLVADLDMDMIIEAKIDFDVVGHYSRPDLFSLSVNQKKLRSVEWSHSKKEEVE